MTNQMGHNNRVRRSWEAYCNVYRPTFQWDDHAHCRAAFDQVYSHASHTASVVIPGRICPWLTNAWSVGERLLVDFGMLGNARFCRCTTTQSQGPGCYPECQRDGQNSTLHSVTIIRLILHVSQLMRLVDS